MRTSRERSMRVRLFRLASLGLVWLWIVGCQQVTIIVQNIPSNTPPGSAIFVSGNFNYWDPGDHTYALTLNPKDSTYAVTLPAGSGTIRYRFTRGDWTTVEADLCGNNLSVRYLPYQQTDTVYTRIMSWKDLNATQCNQVTLILDSLPANTPPQDSLYVSGSFNNWAATDSRYRLKKNASGKYSIRLTALSGEIEYKFHRGSWAKEEVSAIGNAIPNRIFRYGLEDTVQVCVSNWKDLLIPTHRDKVTLIVKVPPSTPDGDRIFLAGNFNNWKPHDPEFELRWTHKWTYTINLPRKRNYLEFKFTRGDWSTVEVDTYGKPTENRLFTYGYVDTMYLEVASWQDLQRTITDKPKK